ncbi:hypothetical protein ANCCAN_14646 [Ancylostoma caninum]|uniref:SCP domain-containing protein n=1 Tax=Ancylostoma caninum TaxID=29170 RepID=A0A368G8W0_ANCCA|nr:hypothetical protein ANCCAN_14646 [Ancylostoma caninum]
MSTLVHIAFLISLWLCFASNRVEAAKPELDPLKLMKLPRTNNLCPEITTAKMNDQARNLIVDIHNRRRFVHGKDNNFRVRSPRISTVNLRIPSDLVSTISA